jgi:hypothetical protein
MAMLLQSALGLTELLSNTLEVKDNRVNIICAHRLRTERIDGLIYNAVFHESERLRYFLCWLIRRAASGLAVYPASVQGLYAAAARGQVRRFTAPAVSLRAMTYDAARACFRAAKETGCGAMILDLGRNALVGPAQPPLEYATCLLAGAIREGYEGPVFLQANYLHERCAADNTEHGDELDRLQDLAEEALDAGFFNLELDTADLEDLSLPDPADQERASCADAAQLAGFVRTTEPAGVDTHLGVKMNSHGDAMHLPHRFRAFMEGFATEFTGRAGHVTGIGKLSLHIRSADELRLIHDLAEVARREYALATGVNYDGAPLPEVLLAELPRLPVVEVHFGTRYEDLILHHPAFPAQLRDAMHGWIDQTYGELRGPEQDHANFYQQMRMEALERFKQQLWDLAPENKDPIMADLQKTFVSDFKRLKVEDTIHLALAAINIQDTELPRPVEGYYHDVEATYRDLVGE